MHESVEDGLTGIRQEISDFKLNCVTNRGDLEIDIAKVDGEVKSHKSKSHLYQVKDEEKWHQRARRHSPEIGIGIGGSTLIFLLIKLFFDYLSRSGG